MRMGNEALNSFLSEEEFAQVLTGAMGIIHTEFIVLDSEEIPEIEEPPFGNGRYRKEEYLDYLLKG